MANAGGEQCAHSEMDTCPAFATNFIISHPFASYLVDGTQLKTAGNILQMAAPFYKGNHLLSVHLLGRSLP